MKHFWESAWVALRINAEVIIVLFSALTFHWYRTHDPSTGVVSQVVSRADHSKNMIQRRYESKKQPETTPQYPRTPPLTCGGTQDEYLKNRFSGGGGT